MHPAAESSSPGERRAVLFHCTQAVYQKVQEQMVIEYEPVTFCRLLLALPLVPHAEIVSVFGWLERLEAHGLSEDYGHPAPGRFW